MDLLVERLERQKKGREGGKSSACAWLRAAEKVRLGVQVEVKGYEGKGVQGQ